MRRILITLVTAGVVAVSGCSGSDTEKTPKEPEVVQAEPGQCVAEEVDDGIDPAPDFTTVVPCSEPHVYEVLDVVPIPKKYLAGTTDAEKLERRAELAEPGSEDASELKLEMASEVFGQCDPTIAQASGLADLTVDGKSGEKVNLQPWSGAGAWFNVTSKEQWLDGQASAVCSVRFTSFQEDAEAPATVAPHASPDDEQLISHYLTKSFPRDLRRCTGGQGNTESVACDAAHVDELLYSMNMRAVYGKDFVRGQDLANVDAGSLAKIEKACLDPYEQAGLSLPSGREMGFRFYSDAVDEDYLQINCTLQTIGDAPTKDYVAFGS